MNPLTNSLPLLWWGIILIVLLGPFRFIHKLIFLIVIAVLYGSQLPTVLYYSMQIFFTIVTGSPYVYRSLANSLVYQHLKCNTIIPLPAKPTIFVVNYPINMLEFTLLGLFPPEAMLVADSRQKWASLAMDEKKIITIERQHKGNYKIAEKKIGDAMKKGSSVIAYVSNAISMKNELDIGKIHKGMFAISKDLQVPIFPIVFDRIRLSSMGAISNKTFYIGLGKAHIVSSVEESMKYVETFFSSSLKEFSKKG